MLKEDLTVKHPWEGRLKVVVWRGRWHYDARFVFDTIWNNPPQAVRARAAKVSLKYPNIMDIKFIGDPEWDGLPSDLYGE